MGNPTSEKKLSQDRIQCNPIIRIKKTLSRHVTSLPPSSVGQLLLLTLCDEWTVSSRHSQIAASHVSFKRSFKRTTPTQSSPRPFAPQIGIKEAWENAPFTL